MGTKVDAYIGSIPQHGRRVFFFVVGLILATVHNPRHLFHEDLRQLIYDLRCGTSRGGGYIGQVLPVSGGPARRHGWPWGLEGRKTPEPVCLDLRATTAATEPSSCLDSVGRRFLPWEHRQSPRDAETTAGLNDLRRSRIKVADRRAA